MRKQVLAVIIAAVASGCTTVPYEQPSQELDWGSAVRMRQQKLAAAEAAVRVSCTKSMNIYKSGEEKVAVWMAENERMATKVHPTVEDMKNMKELDDAYSKARAECLQVGEVWKEEKALHEELKRVLERIAYLPSIDVYHHY